MRFKIVSTGWNCGPWLEQTLRSVESQSIDNWDIWIIYDPSEDDGADRIRDWCDSRRGYGDDRWNYTINASRMFAVRNQYEAVHRLKPKDEDIVLWLDLDGDQLAHDDVLKNLGNYYLDADSPLVTYGSYRAVPDQGTSPPAIPFPPDIVRNNAYRQQMRTGECCFNHLRTMKGRVANAIPQDQFLYQDGPHVGEWYTSAGDYVFMGSALELAGGRYKVIEEVLLLYNHNNPYADYLLNSVASFSTTSDYLNRPPLSPLKDEAVNAINANLSPSTLDPQLFVSLEPTERRELLRQVGRQHGLSVFIETGTNQGLTPWTLRHDFRILFTIELDKMLHDAAVQKFVTCPQVRCLRGDSTTVLPLLMEQITEPALIWLDGHYSGPGTAHGDESTPIREELRVLFEDGRPHVILVDDARIFEGGPEHTMYDHYLSYPSLKWVEEYASQFGYGYELKNDIMFLVRS